MKAFAATLLATAASASLMTKFDYDFMKYISKYNKMYNTTEEFELRKELFRATHNYIAEANAREGSYTAGHNMFSDWTAEEKNGLLGLKGMPTPEETEAVEIESNATPSSWDWRAQGKTTAVKDQGSCGSCWAFSATEVIESIWMIAGNSEQVLAPQQFVDCSWDYNNNGCNGGWYFWAYDYLMGENAKLAKESDYPYTARDQSCKNTSGAGVTGVSGYDKVARKAQAIRDSIYQNGPNNVAVAAGNNVFMYYTGGIITANEGCPTRIDHAIVAVGYGSENGTDYAIVRNSWGTGWGEQGFVRLELVDGYFGTCGVNSYVYYAQL